MAKPLNLTDSEFLVLADALDAKRRSLVTTQGRTKSPRMAEALKVDLAELEKLSVKVHTAAQN